MPKGELRTKNLGYLNNNLPVNLTGDFETIFNCNHESIFGPAPNYYKKFKRPTNLRIFSMYEGAA